VGCERRGEQMEANDVPVPWYLPAVVLGVVALIGGVIGLRLPAHQ
jgi:hypothetical protein